MKHALFCLSLAGTLVFSTQAAFAQSAAADAITGVWETKSGGYVQIYRQGDVFAGRIVGSNDGKPRYDKNNPDKAKRDQRLLGQDILKGLQYEGDKAYGGGTIYDPNNGKTYKAKAELTGPDTLDARGYIGVSLIGKTQTWHRIDPNNEHVHGDTLNKPVGGASQ